MIEEHSLFDRFAANSVRCLNEVSSQGELADKRPVKKASMVFVFRTYNIWICFNLYVQHPTGVNPTNQNLLKHIGKISLLKSRIIIPRNRNMHPIFCNKLCFCKLFNILHIHNITSMAFKKSFFRSKYSGAVGKKFLDVELGTIGEVNDNFFILSF